MSQTTLLNHLGTDGLADAPIEHRVALFYRGCEFARRRDQGSDVNRCALGRSRRHTYWEGSNFEDALDLESHMDAWRRHRAGQGKTVVPS